MLKELPWTLVTGFAASKGLSILLTAFTTSAASSTLVDALTSAPPPECLE